MFFLIHWVYVASTGGQLQTEHSAAAQTLQTCVKEDLICGPLFTSSHTDSNLEHCYLLIQKYIIQLSENIPKVKTLSRMNKSFEGSRTGKSVFPSLTITHLYCHMTAIFLLIL